jgi:Luciferase
MSIRSELERRLTEVPGVIRRRSRHGDSLSYYVGEREIAHFHGDERMDVRLTKELIRQRKTERSLDPRVRTRGPSAEWVAVSVTGAQDIALALELVEEAVRANS